MALVKNITLPGNVVAKYHRIAGCFISDQQRTCEIHLESYKDEDTRRAVVETETGTVPKWEALSRPVCRLNGALFNQVFGAGSVDYPDKASLYAYLRTEPTFENAVDAL